MLIIKDYGGRDWNHDHMLKIHRLHCISALDVENGHFLASGAPFSYVGGLLHVYICVGIDGDVIEGNRR